jgi:hypothetical protein
MKKITTFSKTMLVLAMLTCFVKTQTAPTYGTPYQGCPRNCHSCSQSDSCTVCFNDFNVFVDDTVTSHRSSFCCKETNKACKFCSKNDGECLVCQDNYDLNNGKCKSKIGKVFAIIGGILFYVLLCLLCYCIIKKNKGGGKGRKVYTKARRPNKPPGRKPGYVNPRTTIVIPKPKPKPRPQPRP